MTSIDEKYHGTVATAVGAAAGIGVVGLFTPALDTAGVGATWTGMVIAIAAKSGHELNAAAAAKVVAAALGAVSGYALGSKILTWAAMPLILSFPVAGVPAVVAVNASLNGVFTLKLALATINQFTRRDFNAVDGARLAVAIVSQLHPIPTMDEIRLVKEMITAAL